MKASIKFLLVLFCGAGLVFFLCIDHCPLRADTRENTLPGHPAGKDKAGQNLRIVFYNVENLFDVYDDSITNDDEFLPGGVMHWTNERYRSKLEKIAKALIASGEWNPADIIGLCEIENGRVLEDLVSKTPLLKFQYRFIHRDSPDKRGIDVALLYRPSSVRIVSKTFIPVIPSGKGLAPTREILYFKGIVFNKDTLHLFVNHWPSRSGGQLETEPYRVRAAKTLRVRTDSLFRSHPAPGIIIMGDFNDEPSDKSLSAVLLAQTEFHSLKPGFLYNLAAGYELKNPVGSHKYQGRWSMLDQFLVSGDLLARKKGLAVDPASFAVVDASFLLSADDNFSGEEPFRTYKGPVYTGGFSDHLPVRIDLVRK